MAELSDASPLFVIGTLRSGASLLALALGQHSKLHPVLENPWIEDFTIGLVRSYRAASRQRATSQIDINGIEFEDFLAHFGPAAKKMMASFCPTGGTILDSTSANLFLVAPLRLLFPDAKFLHVVRDANEVVASLASPELRAFYRSRHIECSTADAYDHWLRGTSAGIEAERAFGSGVVHRVRRRDLIADPAATLAGCFAFLGLEFEHSSLRPFSSVVPLSERETRRGLGANERTASTANALSAMLMNGAAPFPGDAALVDRLNADLWRKATRNQRLIPPIPGSPVTVNQQRERLKRLAEPTAAIRRNPANGLGRFIERLRRERSDPGRTAL